MRFADIPGHEAVKQRLRTLVDENRLPHALLLQGPEGAGKFALARALAQYIHCTNRHDGDSCGQCPSCRQMQSHNQIDTIYTFPIIKKTAGKPAVSNDYIHEFTEFIDAHPWMNFDAWMTALGKPNTLPRIYVDEGIELIRRLSYTSHASQYKVALMWLPERLNEDAANKLLKLVEEPFADTVFIMTSDNPREILPTIYSRVQRVEVPRYSTDEVAAILIKQGVDAQMAANVAVLAKGNLNAALSIARDGSAANGDFLEWFISLMRLAYTRKIADLKAWSVKIASESRETQLRFLDYCARMLRENFLYNINDPRLIVMTEAEKAFSKNFARFITPVNVLRLVDQITIARNDIAQNANGKIVFFDLSISVILLLKQ